MQRAVQVVYKDGPLLFLQGDQWVGHDSRDGQSFCKGTIIGSKGWNLGNLGLSSNICSPLKKTALQINRYFYCLDTQCTQ